ncbi:MAG: hypothetical protein DCO99_07515 [Synechococcus sp. XM-24]|nr:MAG: hypothetical protein DCO99_07515 [Synechococcus sp. XM-24]
MSLNFSLFEKNLKRAQSNPNFSLTQTPEQIAQRIEEGPDFATEFNQWKSGDFKVLTLVNLVPKTQDRYELWQSEIRKIGSLHHDGIDSILDQHVDIHLYDILCKIYNILLSNDIDPAGQTGALHREMPALTAFGTGNGLILKYLVDTYAPLNFNIAVRDWDDLASSFFTIDWEEISAIYSNSGKQLSLSRLHSKHEVAPYMFKRSILYAEHHILYKSPINLSSYDELISPAHPEKVNRSISYLGYTLDEYNMLIASAKTISSSVRLYENPDPRYDPVGNILVCASGPSLDSLIDHIRELEANHLIICAASSSRILLKHSIRVDYIVLVEREESIVNDYRQLISEFPEASKIKVVMSSTCSQSLTNIFDEVAVYFRSVLAPLAIHALKSSQVLIGEGPQSVNAAVSFALSLKPNNLCLAGVDLGSISSQQKRSSDALGHCDRIWNIEETGNFSNIIYTNTLMRDTRDVVEEVLYLHPSVNVYNISQGLLIKGATPTAVEKYKDISKTVPKDDADKLFKRTNYWWSILPTSNKSRQISIWDARKPRKHLHTLCNQIVDILLADTPLMPEVLDSVSTLLNLEVDLPSQLPRRILRSTVMKALLCIQQYALLLNSNEETKEKSLRFVKDAREALAQYVLYLESEVNIILSEIDPHNAA